MRKNLDDTLGNVLAEKAAIVLGKRIGKTKPTSFWKPRRAKLARRIGHWPRFWRRCSEVAKHYGYRRTQQTGRSGGLFGIGGNFHAGTVERPKGLTMPVVIANKTRLFYRLEGSDGLPVLALSHSIGTDHGMWEPQVHALLHYFRILQYDTRGHGGSEAPGGEYTIESWAAIFWGFWMR